MKQNFSIYIFLCILFLGSAACQDDLLYNGGEIGEGESLVSATVNFKPLTPALNGNTRAAGDIIKSINSLCVLLYNEKGELLKTYPLEYAGDGVTTPGEGKYTLKDMDRSEDKKTESIGGEDKDLPSAESQTPHANFKLTIPYGRYHIYAVANMGNLSTYSDAIQTIEGLKSISLTWDADNIAKNNQMFGYFTVKGSEQQDELAIINQPKASLHASIRRAASKVTIAYDGSALHENVFIYLKSVTIKDIPTECYLGKESTINLDENSENKYGALTDGESITYAEGTTSYDEHYPARITKGKPFYYYTNKEKAPNGVSVWKADYEKDQTGYAKLAHGEENEALFFYENMQGTGKDKRQDADGNGELDAPGINNDPTDKFYKDQKPYGTYIEVKAYYVSNVHGRVSNGDIIYRFMLGKNVTTDYNAERNHHYKLTLKFNKYANDVDWHIEYEEPDPGIEVPNPYYISYLYNHSMMLPLKIRTGGKTIQEIEAKIVDNRWAPNNPDKDFAYCEEMDLPYQNQWNGFLSLRRTKDLVLPNQNPITVTSNQAYYEEHKRGERKYIEGIALPKEGESQSYGDDEGDGKYIIENEGDTVYHLQVPLYTRAKQLMKASAYTGNNPYVAYQRKAEIKIVVTFTDGTQISTDGTNFSGIGVTNGNDKDLKNPVIYQVRRIVNPKGVWRKHNNYNKFHVQLKRLPKENETQFTSFASEGSWKAYVYCGTENFITLSNNNATTPGEEVGGETGSMIDFDINFNGTCGKDENRYAIIRVEYHNYTCYHLIFVRQGDAPDSLIEEGSEWLAYNMKTKNKTTDSPLEEGSLFKFGNWDYPIDAMCNKNPTTGDGYWINVKPSSFVNNSNNLLIATDDNFNKKTAKWSDIVTSYSSTTPAFAEPNIENTKIASYNDFAVLYHHEDIAEGYGVLYGDESNETLDDLKEVYEYDYEHTGRGMRGSFVYNKVSGKSLFFPIGASGYGHRKEADRDITTSNNKGAGILRYSSNRNEEFPNEKIGNGSVYPNGLIDAPLFYDIYMRPGAVYWLDQYADARDIDKTENANALGWDFNYFTFDFFPYGAYAAQQGKNAAFIRCVKKK